MTVYQFCYTSCIYESAPETVSVHFTEQGATKAMEAHKQAALAEWTLGGSEDHPNSEFGEFEKWGTWPIQIID